MIEINFAQRKPFREMAEGELLLAWQAPFEQRRFIVPLLALPANAALHLFVVFAGEELYIGPVTRGRIQMSRGDVFLMEFIGTLALVKLTTLIRIDQRTQHILRCVFPGELLQPTEQGEHQPLIIDETTVVSSHEAERGGVRVLV